MGIEIEFPFKANGFGYKITSGFRIVVAFQL